MQRRAIIPAFAVMALLLTASLAQAGQWAGCPRAQAGYGPGYGAQAALTPEQSEKVQAIVDKYREKNFEVREQLWAKSTELDALVDSGKATRSDIQDLTSQISKMRASLFNNRQAMSQEISKETGIPANVAGCGFGYGRGPGFSGDGPGPGYGYGRHGGHGPHGQRGQGGCGYGYGW